MRGASALFRLASLAGAAALRNAALVFLKPHAANDACEAFLRGHLSAAGIEVGPTCVKAASEIDKRKLIDQHYGALAQLAMETQPSEMSISPVAEEAFAAAYGLSWSDALPSMLRNDEALTTLGVDGVELEKMWRGGVQVKLAPGTYVSRLDLSDAPTDAPADTCFTINGFYPSMRQKFVSEGAAVRCMVCEWDESRVSWKEFRREVIGATDPSDAQPGSARAELLSRWQELGLASEPNMALNGVHASAGPLEGLKERCVWADASLETDELARALLGDAAIDKSTLERWLAENPVVTLGEVTDKIFDLTEEISAASVVELAKSAAKE